MSKAIIEATDLSFKVERSLILENISFSVHSNESWVITGSSGSGKTTLGRLLAGQLKADPDQLKFNLPDTYKRVFISQQHDFRHLASTRSYYQQRYDSNVADDSPTVENLLHKTWQKASPDTGTPAQELTDLTKLLKIDHILGSRLSQLSNGEGKRVQLAQALIHKPQILIFDSPFIGLDKNARQILHSIILELIHSGIILFLITTPDEIPEEVSHVIELKAGKIRQISERKDYIASHKQKDKSVGYVPMNKEVLDEIPFSDTENFAVAVEMKNVNVTYGDKKVLQNINWKINKGEKWALLGHNGAGKSTLLSLINGDNPQAYNNEVYLFDHKRGSGESIWDIKRKIGYISPELHIFFQRNATHTEAVSISAGQFEHSNFSQAKTTCFEAIASGFNDQIGSSQQITPLQSRQVIQWMDLLHIKQLKTKPLYQTSLGEQRLVLLARALVRNPALLILDEPCQGLDKEQTARFIEVVDTVCRHFNKTLIYISHYIEEIPSCVEHQLILKNGKTTREM